MIRKLFSTPIATALLLVLAAGLIGYGGVNAAAAAPRIVSEWYGAEVVLSNIETAIVENDFIVEDYDSLLKDSFFKANLNNGMTETGEGFTAGRTYNEVLKAQNVGTIPQYVRVTVYHYWAKAGVRNDDGSPIKRTDLDPKLIQLHFVTGENGWTIDTAASTDERTVLYYVNPDTKNEGGYLPVGKMTNEFVDKLYVSPEVATAMDENGNLLYDGVECYIAATVDAVQTHNAQEAMTGAWGRTN